MKFVFENCKTERHTFYGALKYNEVIKITCFVLIINSNVRIKSIHSDNELKKYNFLLLVDICFLKVFKEVVNQTCLVFISS